MDHIIGNTYTTTIGNAQIGLYITGRDTVLIDTGRGESETMLAVLREHDLVPTAILNTHLHIDHIGSNKLLQETYGCAIYCTPEEIKDKDGNAGIVQPNPVGGPFRFIALPGHSIAHQAVVTPDGVCFLGDAVMSKGSKLPYHLDPAKAIASMEQILSLPYSCYVLSHAGIYDSAQVRRIAEDNLRREDHFQSQILSLFDGRKIKTEKVAALFLDSLGISREKQDIKWVTDTAMARIRQLEDQKKLAIREGYASLV